MTIPNAPEATTAAYAAAVRAALAHLSPEHRDVLLEDLEDHLDEIVAGSEIPLQERLGPPEQYAAELRAAYGLTGLDTAAVPAQAPAWAGLAARISRVTGSQPWRETRQLAKELRPGWWLLRAYLLVIATALFLHHPAVARALPNPTTSRGLLQVAATIVAMVVSVRIGRRGRLPRRSLRAGLRGANIALALLTIPLLTTAVRVQSGPDILFPPDAPGFAQSVYAGAPLLNIFPYSSDGKPLHGVLLYDQDGNPVTVTGKGFVAPRSYPTDAAGQPVTNAYPLDLVQPDGQPIPAPRVALPAQPIPAPSASPSPRP